MKYTAAQYYEVNKKLPPEIRDVVVSTSTVDKLYEIGKKHNLLIDDMGKMVNLTLDIIMGMSPARTFVQDLLKEVDIKPLEASTLIRDIDEEILKPIKHIMISLYADGAPNRPSSSLVQYYEEDDNHPSLDKDALLKEIEEPVASPIRKEMVMQPASEVASSQASKQNSREIPNKLTSLPANKLEIYHEEIVGTGNEVTSLSGSKEIKGTASKLVSLQDSKEVPKQIPPHQLTTSPAHDLNPNNLTSSSANKLANSDLLNKIAEMKLSKTFVMPRGEGANQLKSLEVPARPSPARHTSDGKSLADGSPAGGDIGGQGFSLEGNKSTETSANSKLNSLGLRSLEGNSTKPNLGATNSNPIKPEAINKTESPKPASTTIDPYREKI